MTEIFQIIGMTFSFFLALIIIRKRQYIFYGITFIFCGLILLEKYLWKTEYINNYPALAEVFVPLSFSIPLCLYLANKKVLKNKILWIVFVIPIIPYINFIPLYTASIDYKLCYIQYEIIESLTENCNWIARFAPTIINDSIIDVLLILEFGILLFLLKLDKKENSTSKSFTLKSIFASWNNIVFGIVCIACLAIIIDILLVPDNVFFSSYFISVIGFLTCTLILDNSTLLKEVIASNVYKKLSEKEISELYHKIESTLYEDKCYSDNELTLISLAGKVGVSANKMSYVLSFHNTSFKKLINSIRIKKATEFMVRNGIENYSIEGIAKMFGYKSKSTFYQNFKNTHLKTPKEFIIEHQKGSKT